MNRFSFLREIVNEQRSYDYSAGHLEMIENEMARLTQEYPDEQLPKFEAGPVGNWGYPSLTVSHVFVPAKCGVGIIEKEFNIRLPNDFLDFYKRWNEGFLLVRNPIVIMSPERIIEEANDIRKAHQISKDLPHHIVRFGDLGEENFFLLRHRPHDGDWEVLVSNYSQSTDADLQDRSSYCAPCDATFTAWLQRMIATDGAPLHPDYPDNEDDFFNKRVV